MYLKLLHQFVVVKKKKERYRENEIVSLRFILLLNKIIIQCVCWRLFSFASKLSCVLTEQRFNRERVRPQTLLCNIVANRIIAQHIVTFAARRL